MVQHISGNETINHELNEVEGNFVPTKKSMNFMVEWDYTYVYIGGSSWEPARQDERRTATQQFETLKEVTEFLKGSLFGEKRFGRYENMRNIKVFKLNRLETILDFNIQIKG